MAKHGTNPQALANEAGVSDRLVYKVKNAEGSVKQVSLEKIAKALGEDWRELVDLEAQAKVESVGSEQAETSSKFRLLAAWGAVAASAILVVGYALGFAMGERRGYEKRAAQAERLPVFKEADIKWDYQFPVIPVELHDQDILIFYHQARIGLAQRLGTMLATHGVVPEDEPRVFTKQFGFTPNDVYHNQAYFAVDTVYKDILSERLRDVFEGQELMLHERRFPKSIDLVIVLYDYHSHPDDPIYPKLTDEELEYDAVILFSPDRLDLAQQLTKAFRGCSLLSNKAMKVAWVPLDKTPREIQRKESDQLYFSGSKIVRKKLLELTDPYLDSEKLFVHATAFAGEVDVLLVLGRSE